MSKRRRYDAVYYGDGWEGLFRFLIPQAEHRRRMQSDFALGGSRQGRRRRQRIRLCRHKE